MTQMWTQTLPIASKGATNELETQNSYVGYFLSGKNSGEDIQGVGGVIHNYQAPILVRMEAVPAVIG